MQDKRQDWLLGLLITAFWAVFLWAPSTQAAETTDSCLVCPIELQPQVFFVQGLAALGSFTDHNKAHVQSPAWAGEACSCNPSAETTFMIVASSGLPSAERAL